MDQILEAVMAAVRRAERFLGPQDDWVEDDRRIAYEAAQRHLGHLHTFVREKGAADYVTTVHATPDAIERALTNTGYQRNLLSSRKYRTHHDGGRQWAVGSFVLDDIDHNGKYTRQHHVYLFEAPDGGADVYAHTETSVLEGYEHVSDTRQSRGDPHGLFDVFARCGFEYGHRQL
jgi:hypothetical protein